MPNYCFNCIRVDGAPSDIKAFFADTFGNSKEFDFNTLIQMPTEYDDAEIIEDETFVLIERHDVVKKTSDDLTPGERTMRILALPDGMLRAAKHSASLFDRYGHANWCDWSMANWGTNRNASTTQFANPPTDFDHEFEFCFDTAWCPPEPIFRKISEKYPALRFDFKCIETCMAYGGTGSDHGIQFVFEVFDDRDPRYAALAEDLGFVLEDEDDEDEEA